MAISILRNIWVYSGRMVSRKRQMSASQGVLIPFSPLRFPTSSDGTLTRVITDDTAMLGFLAGSVVNATTWPITTEYSVNDEVIVAIPDAKTIFGLSLENATNDQVTAQAQVGDVVGITVQSSGSIGYVTGDVAETSNTMFTIVDILPNAEPEIYTNTDTVGIALVKITGTLQG